MKVGDILECLGDSDTILYIFSIDTINGQYSLIYLSGTNNTKIVVRSFYYVDTLYKKSTKQVILSEEVKKKMIKWSLENK
jgi:hypothetical protein